jgi:hypothetical protein
MTGMLINLILICATFFITAIVVKDKENNTEVKQCQEQKTVLEDIIATREMMCIESTK